PGKGQRSREGYRPRRKSMGSAMVRNGSSRSGSVREACVLPGVGMTDAELLESPGLRRQRELYARGLEGRGHDWPVRLGAREQRARAVLSPGVYDYVAGGAGSEDTVRANREAFRRWRIVPRFLRNVDRRDLRVEMFGQRFSAPFLFAPVGVQSILHPDAE